MSAYRQTVSFRIIFLRTNIFEVNVRQSFIQLPQKQSQTF